MRDLKFRAWDRTENTFIDISRIVWDWDNTEYESSGSISYNNRFAWSILSLKNTDRLIWQQHTWLKDKNWVEIYEGGYT